MTKPNTSVSASKDVHVLDVRSVHPRDRHRAIFDALDGLDVGETLRLVNDHDPAPLRYQLDAEHPDTYSWVPVEQGPDRWVVDIISRARVVDARSFIGHGHEPYETIMDSASATEADEVLIVYTPLEPVAIRDRLADQGFDHDTTRVTETIWRVRFKRI